MAALTVQQIGLGTLITYAAATVTVGDTVAPDDRTAFRVVNGSGGSINATLVVPGTVYGQARPDVVVAIAAGATREFGPLVGDLADPTTGLCTLICSAVTSVTIAAVRI